MDNSTTTEMDLKADLETAEKRMAQVGGKLWDSIRLQLMDLHFDGKISKAQVRATCSIFWAAWNKMAFVGAPESWEKIIVEKFQVEKFETSGRLSVVIRMNRTDFQETLASILCSTYGHFFIGTRGGIEAKTARPGSIEKAKAYPLIYGWDR